MLRKKIIALGVFANAAVFAAPPATIHEKADDAKPRQASRDVSRLLSRLCAPFRHKGVAVTLQGWRYAPEQARNPNEGVASIDARQSVLLLPDGRFMLRTSTVYPGNIEFRFKTVGSPQEELTIDEIGWRDGDILTRDDAASSAKDYADLRMLVPSLLACDALVANASGEAARLRYQDSAGRMVTLHLSLRAIESSEVGTEDYRYDGWRNTGSLRLPTIIERRKGKKVIARWTRTQALPIRGYSAKLSNIQANYRAPDPSGVLRATPLGGGAYRVDGSASGYHTGFVVGARGVAIFDAPVGVEDAKVVRALIERTSPNVPIAYVVLSHVHGDHIAGLPVYGDAEIITGAGGGVAIRRLFGLGSRFRMREITEPTDIDLGGQSVGLFPINSSHASTMVVSFAPASKALFQGDLFYLPERGAVPAAFKAGFELKRLIVERKLDVRYIIGVHGRTGTLNDLQRAVAQSVVRGNDRGGIGMIPPLVTK